MKFLILMFMLYFVSCKKYVPHPECDFCEVYDNMDEEEWEGWLPSPEQWEEHFRNYHQTPGGGQRFTPNTSDEDTVDISSDDDDDEPQEDMVLLPDNTDEFAADAGRHVHSTPLHTPPPSPDVIEIVAVDQNRRRNKVTHHPPLGGAKAPRKRPASAQNPSSKKVCFKKDSNSRPILLQDTAIVEAGPAIRDPLEPGPSGVRPSQPIIGEAGPSREADIRVVGQSTRNGGGGPSGQAGPSRNRQSGRLGKGKAKNPGKARNPNIQPEPEPEPEPEPKQPPVKQSTRENNLRLHEKFKQGKISELKMRRMGFLKNCELSIRKKELGGKITIDIICMTKFGEMSVAQYREFFCGVGRDWEEEDPEDDSVEFINDETTTSSSQTTTTTPMTPLLADDLYNKMFSSTTPRPGSLGGGGSLLMMANVSPSAVFHSCAKIMPMRRRKRALPLIFGGLLTILIASVATQQTIVDKMVNPVCPDGYINFSHRCIKQQPERCPIGF